jgi:hypothetical protein
VARESVGGDGRGVRKRWVFVGLVLAFLLGCGASGAIDDDDGDLRFVTRTNDSDNTLGGSFYEVTIGLKDGRELPCVLWKQRVGTESRSYGGLTCDWDARR